MYCKECGNRLEDENAKYCGHCGVLLTQKGNSANFKETKCPNCNASIPYGDCIERINCNFCGAMFVIDDRASEMNRMLRVQSDAVKRDTQTRMVYENHQSKLEREREIMQFVMSNGLKLVLLLLCVIYILYKVFSGQLVALDFIMMLIVFGVFIMPRNDKKGKKP